MLGFYERARERWKSVCQRQRKRVNEGEGGRGGARERHKDRATRDRHACPRFRCVRTMPCAHCRRDGRGVVSGHRSQNSHLPLVHDLHHRFLAHVPLFPSPTAQPNAGLRVCQRRWQIHLSQVARGSAAGTGVAGVKRAGRKLQVHGLGTQWGDRL